ncbi:MAG: hypothetical protein QY312_03005 [Candidatus Dojkabacteria bacterium]|nr:MAG: hypothetical protein QY312_03005 [Candidatus Dojkabacteria bacterium]
MPQEDVTPQPSIQQASLNDTPVTTLPQSQSTPTEVTMDENIPIQPLPANIMNDAAANGGRPPVDASRIGYWSETQYLVDEIEKNVGMKVITLYIPLFASLSESDVNNFFYHIERIGKQEKLAILLFGPGGSGAAAYRLIKLIRTYTKVLVVLVPDAAASAMTMFSLGADLLMTGPLTTFSAIDSSLANHKLAPRDENGSPVSVEITQIVKFLEMVKADTYDSTDFSKGAYKALTEKVHPLLLGAIQRSFSLSKRLTASILKTHMSDEAQIQRIVDKLNDEFPTHSYPVLAEDLTEMGIKTSEMSVELNRLCTNLIDLYRVFASGGSRVDGNKKSTWDRPSVFESNGFRTWYHNERVSMLNDKNDWRRTGGYGEYRHAGEIMTKQGYIKIDTLNPSQLKNWLDGKTVHEE